jgi:hypothetical protein
MMKDSCSVNEKFHKTLYPMGSGRDIVASQNNFLQRVSHCKFTVWGLTTQLRR